MIDVLGTALTRDGHQPAEILADLQSGRHAAFRVLGPASGFVVLTTGYPIGLDTLTLWILLVGGSVAGGPRQRMAVMKAILSEVEMVARGSGCGEIRIEGRSTWRRILIGFEQIQGADGRPIFRKALLDG